MGKGEKVTIWGCKGCCTHEIEDEEAEWGWSVVCGQGYMEKWEMKNKEERGKRKGKRSLAEKYNCPQGGGHSRE